MLRARMLFVGALAVLAVLASAGAPLAANADRYSEEGPGQYSHVGPDASAFRDILTTEGNLITASEQRENFPAAMERLDPNRGPNDKPLPVVTYADGTVALGEPVPFAEQQRGPDARAAGSSSAEAVKDLGRVGEMERSSEPTFTQEAIFGSDDRYRATPTNYYPRNAVGRLQTADRSNCSGVLYRSNKFVTAAHCLYDHANGAWRPGPWYFEPAQDGSTHNLAECYAVQGAILADYTRTDHPKNDLGMVKLSCSYPGSIGNGYYPLVAISANPQSYKDGLYIVGYPLTAKGNSVRGQQWEHSGRLIYDTSYLKTLNVDSSGGQSGGLWAVPCQEYGWYYCMVGPHYGHADFLYGGMNVGHQFTSGDITLLANF